LNSHLKHDAREVTDAEVDLVDDRARTHPISPAQLRAFPTDADIPADALNAKIDETFVPVARVEPPRPGEFAATKQRLVGELRRVSLNGFPNRIEPAKLIAAESPRRRLIETESGITVPLVVVRPVVSGKTKRVALVVLNESELSTLGLVGDAANASPGAVKLPDWLSKCVADDAALIVLEPRGIGATRWTKKNPPNYVERSLVLLGRTADTGRLWDIVAAARHVHRNASGAVESTEPPTRLPVEVIGRGAAGLLSAYAALLEDEIAGATVVAPPESHMAPGAPQLLNILRVADVAQWLGLLAPKPLTLHNAPPELEATVKKWQAASRK
ncbi:MAG TPA: hypothetical protein PLV92_30505, partial [Pirellulaceae bacterium]|nr:hypothetical protein [Pirellulaceae bacterium]